MSTPLANKTTASSRNKLAQAVADHASTASKMRSMAPPPAPSQIARNPALRSSAMPSTNFSSRISNLSNGIPTSIRESRLHTIHQSGTATNGRPASDLRTPATTMKAPTKQTKLSQIASRIPPATAKIDRRSNAITAPSTRISSAANSRVNGALSSRSPSILSSISSITNNNNNNHSRQTSNLKDGRSGNHNIPDTNSIRKGLAKFSNPMECQRQFHALNQKLREMNDTLMARDRQVGQLQEQLKSTEDQGLCYALVVQYFAKMLKLDSPLDLPAECEQLALRIKDLEAKENEFKQQLDIIVNDYQSHIKVEQDLRANIEQELSETRIKHAQVLENLSTAHQDELIDLKDEHSAIQDELLNKIATLESDLDMKCKELTDLRTNHEALTISYSKLEESLTKDKDARVKYAQEKINQLQKDVDSLNSVLEMRSERMHVLERDSILLTETQAELAQQKEITKSLGQQLESLEAALEKRKEQFENLIAEHEKIRQELKHERLDSRRRTNVRRTSEIFSTP